jgi:cystathionine gamma-synthase
LVERLARHPAVCDVLYPGFPHFAGHRATSLGGIESLIEHRASIEGPGSPVPDDLLRLSVGLEATEDLWEGLAAALTT